MRFLRLTAIGWVSTAMFEWLSGCVRGGSGSTRTRNEGGSDCSYETNDKDVEDDEDPRPAKRQSFR